jgi:hypothetical protein
MNIFTCEVRKMIFGSTEVDSQADKSYKMRHGQHGKYFSPASHSQRDGMWRNLLSD